MSDHIWLAHFPKINYARHKKMAAHFLNTQKLAKADWNDLCKIGWDENIAHEFIIWREQNPWEKISERLKKENIAAIPIDSDDYPELLKQINDPPWVLFVRGKLPANHTKQLWLGVVGTRRHSLYGKQVCLQITEELAQQGVIIVSGLALGIDSWAHQATLNKNGITIAVLGSSVDRAHVYPRAHEALAEKIIESGGALVSEFPPDFSPTQYSFPARNRIIAGLTAGTLVIEAPGESGALITAQCALDYNREVFAIPHPITSQTGEGNNKLIKNGAALVCSANDILEILDWQDTKTMIQPALFSSNPEEMLVLEHIAKEPKSIDNIIQETKLESGKTLSILTLLEMKGIIKNLGGGQYIKH